ncbi:MAG: ATP-dependent metallopeptidase FtsH/Yme1/Tma family protein [Treponema sp.]|nr:ATP-dependent metallopeptidase FtsH/Yme1/Tma family protein [Treponema sp.]
MKIKLQKKLILFFAVLLIGVSCAYFFLSRNSKTYERVPYSAFYTQVEEGAIQSVVIESSSITFTTKDNKTFVTENPDSPFLKEFLLRNDVKVSEQSSTVRIISLVFDYSFYIIFFVILFVLFKRYVNPTTFKVVKNTGVKFSDVVGMEKLKRDMIQVIDIMNHPKKYAQKGIRMPKGILLEGAPGNGKTLFARALAGEAHVNFIPTKATDFESMFMAIGPAKVKMLFRKARKVAPCIVFIDEFDGIGTRRNYSGSAIETENTRIVTALLNELDGFQVNSGVLVLAATNSISALDEALIRPGRFDARFFVPYPNAEEREQLVTMYLRGKNYSEECSVPLLASMFEKFSSAKIESVLNRASLIAEQNERQKFLLQDVKQAILEN